MSTLNVRADIGWKEELRDRMEVKLNIDTDGEWDKMATVFYA